MQTEVIQIYPELSIKSLLFEEASISDLPDAIQSKFLEDSQFRTEQDRQYKIFLARMAEE